MANISTQEGQDSIGRQTAGYTRGLPVGISLFDDAGKVAPILTDVTPSATFASSGMLVWDSVASTLKVWTGAAWVSATLA